MCSVSYMGSGAIGRKGHLGAGRSQLDCGGGRVEEVAGVCRKNALGRGSHTKGLRQDGAG